MAMGGSRDGGIQPGWWEAARVVGGNRGGGRQPGWGRQKGWWEAARVAAIAVTAEVEMKNA